MHDPIEMVCEARSFGAVVIAQLANIISHQTAAKPQCSAKVLPDFFKEDLVGGPNFQIHVMVGNPTTILLTQLQKFQLTFPTTRRVPPTKCFGQGSRYVILCQEFYLNSHLGIK